MIERRRPAADGGEPSVIHADEHLLVVNKPSGLPTTSPDGERCLASWAREHDPGAPKLHPSSRLDAEVTGLVTFARTRRAIQQLMAARAAGRYRRFYIGLSERAPVPAAGEWRASIARDRADVRKRSAVDPGEAGGALEAWSRYRTLAGYERVALLLLMPETGRTHQLRVHAAHAGIPLLGDKHYGGAVRVTLANGRVVAARRVMLHCARLVIPAIEGAAVLDLAAPIPADMRGTFAALGGEVTELDAPHWPAD